MSVTGHATLSIVIVSAYDSIRLNQTLDSLPTDVSGLEVIIVCPKNDVLTQDLSSSFARSVIYPVNIVLDENSGIYPAMNLGIVKASGRYILFWNSGDLCYSLENLSTFLAALSESSSLWGVAQGDFSWRPPLELSLRNVWRFVFQSGGYISHQCVYAQKAIIAELGYFDTKYRVAADAKLISELWLAAKPSLINIVITQVEFPSFSANQQRTGRAENFKIAMQVLPFPGNVIAIMSAAGREVSYLIRKIIRVLGRNYKRLIP